MKTHFRISLIAIIAILLCPLHRAEAGRPMVSDRAEAGRPMGSQPVEMTATDLLTKALGVIEDHLTKEQCAECSKALLGLVPQEDETGLWLESADGFTVAYDGLTPDVAAHALYSGDTLSSFAYFFTFPTSAGQARFCGALLQELNDLGLAFDRAEGGSPMDDILFDLIGEYGGNAVSIRLLDQPGQYILALTVEK